MHVLGMAKSSLSLKGAKGPKLELDFFKLAFAVEALRASNTPAIGYLQVLSAPAQKRALYWIEKYRTGDTVTILYTAPSDVEMTALAAEKARNASGLLSTSNAEKAATMLSLAALGQELGESALAKEIKLRHATVVRILDKIKFPQQIDWDFYGVVPPPAESA
jgi:hypothetical protein